VIAKRLSGSTPATLFALVVTQTMSALVWHGASARFDPLVVCGFMVAAALIVVDLGMVGVVLAAGVVGVMLLFSLKAALFLPSLLLLLVCQRPSIRRVLPGFVVVSGATFFAGFAWHASTLAATSALPSATRLATAGPLAWATKVFTAGLLPRHAVLRASLRHDAIFWIVVVAALVGAVVLLRAARQTQTTQRPLWAALALALPLGAVLVYRNAWVYFFVSIVPPLAPLVAVVTAEALRRRPRVATATIVALAVVLAGRVALHAQQQRDEVSEQRQVLDVVHAVFPTPVPYIDRCSMVATFQKVGPFLSTWVVENYRADQHAVFVDVVHEEQPRFLLADGALDFDAKKKKNESRLLPDDEAILRRNFVPVWGPLWVAGHALELRAGVIGDVSPPAPQETRLGDKPQSGFLFEAQLIGGDVSPPAPQDTRLGDKPQSGFLFEAQFVNDIADSYRSDAPVEVDGIAYAAGAAIPLSRGTHTLRASQPTARLLTTSAVLQPTWPPAPKRLFRKQQRGLFER
jgi:hypothetical protein